MYISLGFASHLRLVVFEFSVPKTRKDFLIYSKIEIFKAMQRASNL